MAQTKVDLDGDVLALDAAVKVRRSDPDRQRRFRAAEAIHAALAPSAGVITACYDALIADRLAVDALRGLTHPRQWSDMENDVPGDRVDAMLTYVENHNDLARKLFDRKAVALGLTRLSSVDEHVSTGTTGGGGDTAFSWDDAVALVVAAFAGVSPVLAGIAQEIVDGGNVDAMPRMGKMANAFCLDAGRTRAPLISMNFTGQPADIPSLAHEMGHAVHFVLSGSRQSGLSYDGSTVVSEAAATLLELVVRKHMMAVTEAMPAGLALQSSIDSVFRQVMLTRFEERAYAARAEGARLTPALLTSFWREVNIAFYGDALEVLPSFDLDWMRIEHFIQSRFYNYAYILVHLCALAVTSRLAEAGDDLGERIVEFLSLGGSVGPREQFRVLGLDLTGGDLWTAGTTELTDLLAMAG